MDDYHEFGSTLISEAPFERAFATLQLSGLIIESTWPFAARFGHMYDGNFVVDEFLEAAFKQYQLQMHCGYGKNRCGWWYPKGIPMMFALFAVIFVLLMAVYAVTIKTIISLAILETSSALLFVWQILLYALYAGHLNPETIKLPCLHTRSFQRFLQVYFILYQMYGAVSISGLQLGVPQACDAYVLLGVQLLTQSALLVLHQVGSFCQCADFDTLWMSGVAMSICLPIGALVIVSKHANDETNTVSSMMVPFVLLLWSMVFMCVKSAATIQWQSRRMFITMIFFKQKERKAEQKADPFLLKSLEAPCTPHD